MQFRRILPDADGKQLKEIFVGRKNYAKKILKKVTDMIACGLIESKVPMK
jgi:hypothetical protein